MVGGALSLHRSIRVSDVYTVVVGTCVGMWELVAYHPSCEWITAPRRVMGHTPNNILIGRMMMIH